MKTIITLGLVALSFNSTKAANEFKAQKLNQQVGIEVKLDTFEQCQIVKVNTEINVNTTENNSEDTTIFDANTVVKTNCKKTVEEIIAENKLITENQEIVEQPLSLEKNTKDYIDEDNQIIESSISSDVYPLDFEKINRSVKSDKMSNNNLAVTVDLKL